MLFVQYQAANAFDANFVFLIWRRTAALPPDRPDYRRPAHLRPQLCQVSVPILRGEPGPRGTEWALRRAPSWERESCQK